MDNPYTVGVLTKCLYVVVPVYTVNAAVYNYIVLRLRLATKI